jgi:hypothetical protein
VRGEGPPRIVFAWSAAGGDVPDREHHLLLADAVDRARLPGLTIREVSAPVPAT